MKCNNPDTCLSCGRNRQLPNCLCPASFYVDGSGQCLYCNAKCATCDNADKCLTCKPNRTGESCE